MPAGAQEAFNLLFIDGIRPRVCRASMPNRPLSLNGPDSWRTGVELYQREMIEGFVIAKRTVDVHINCHIQGDTISPQ